MKKYTVILFVLPALLFSCKRGGSNEAEIPDAALGKPVEEIYLLSNQKDLSDTLILSQRKQAEAIIKERLDTTSQQLSSVLEKDVYQIQAVLRGSEVVFDEQVKAGWLDFAVDNTYKYGIYEEHMGGGRYHFLADKSLILLLDNNPGIKPQEFQALINGDALVLVGQDTYRDNNMQAKLNRMPGLPKPKQMKNE
jgi:hypothetical protein